ncbi:hypothetical protein AVEN_164013-1 [Araneus ventricosus]|uniref:Uncharacterized protein n=1 Tax=Araneus ventricosus TaxID=182803 RepID=A0A4Y2D887_ARAVE|nr:hypothetical protein AVEN_164013-1 [Araneus ventricosus]
MTRATPELAPPSSSFRTKPVGGHLEPTDLTCIGPAYTAVVRWNRVLNLEPSGPDVGTLPPSHNGLCVEARRREYCFRCRLRPLTPIQSYEFRPKIALVKLQNES